MAQYLVSLVSGYVQPTTKTRIYGNIKKTVVEAYVQTAEDLGALSAIGETDMKLTVSVEDDFSDTSGVAYGCLLEDCRPPLSVAVNY